MCLWCELHGNPYTHNTRKLTNKDGWFDVVVKFTWQMGFHYSNFCYTLVRNGIFYKLNSKIVWNCVCWTDAPNSSVFYSFNHGSLSKKEWGYWENPEIGVLQTVCFIRWFFVVENFLLCEFLQYLSFSLSIARSLSFSFPLCMCFLIFFFVSIPFLVCIISKRYITMYKQVCSVRFCCFITIVKCCFISTHVLH